MKFILEGRRVGMQPAIAGAGVALRARGPRRRPPTLLAALGLAFLGGWTTRLAPAQVKELKEPSDPKVRRVKPYPKPAPQVKKLRRTQAEQASDDPREDKMRRPRPKAPKAPKDYLPPRILSSFAQEVGSRREQTTVVNVVAQDAIARARKVRDAEVSRAKADYERVCNRHKANCDVASLMQKIAEKRYSEARMPRTTRLTWNALLWQAAERAVRPEMSKRRAKKAFELATEDTLGAPFKKVWGWQ